MPLEVKRRARFSVLLEEMESIRVADKMYLACGKDKNRGMIADYQLRQERLKEIKSELAELRN
jgi:hypothetical protein